MKREEFWLKYLITGAAGFIGSAISSSLAIDGNHVLGVDNFSNYYSRDLKNERVEKLMLTSGVKVLEGDISEYNFISKIVKSEKPDFVIHLAAQAGVRLPLNKMRYQMSFMHHRLVYMEILLRSLSPN